MVLAFWVCACVTAASALVSLGFSLTAVRVADSSSASTARYALSRSLALAVVALLALFSGSTVFLAAVAIAMIVVQASDAVVGVVDRDRLKTIGPAAICIVNLAAFAWLLTT